jgi:subtilisin family serine protease
MKSKLMFTALLIFAFSIAKAQEPKLIPGQYIVILNESAAPPVLKKQKKNNDREKKFNDNKPEREKNAKKIKEVQNKKNIKASSVLNEFTDVTVGFSAKLTEAEKKALESDNEVAGVYQDFEVELPPFTLEPNPSDVGHIFNRHMDEGENGFIIAKSGPYWQAGIDNTANNTILAKKLMPAQVVPCGITKAGGFVDGSTKSTWIWILDSGIDTSHPDLNVNTSSTYAKNFTTEAGVNDLNGHGTHVAGTAAAKNNSIGVVGVSAGARVVPIKVLRHNPTTGRASGEWSWILAGLDHVSKYDIPGDVINMSLGAYNVSNCENSWAYLRDCIRNLGIAGTHVVMAAGNDAGDAALALPGCINGTRVYTVGNISCTNVCAPSSNWNTSLSVPVDWAAVGTNVYSTYKGGGYATMSGTSMAAPHVAGIVHARNAAPLSAGTVTCKNKAYNIARR